MTTIIEPEILSREIVKPSSTSINHPETHTRSFFDQIFPRIYIPMVYFYTVEDRKVDFHSSDALKKSLSTALSLYYPLAGRSNKDNLTIDCNDEGVLFLDARIGCNLSEVLNHSSFGEDIINLLFPDGLQYKDSNLNSPLVVQITGFDCGGMAIAICFSHAVMDTSSICCFCNNWASLARSSCDPEEITNPEFNFGTLYPPNDLPEAKAHVDEFMRVKCVQRSFVFDYAKIAKLKAMVRKEVVENPTRVEVVTALVLKCAVSARARSSSCPIKPVTIRLPVNLRTRVCPPFSERDMGNFVGSIFVTFSKEDIDKLEWDQMAGKIRNEKCKYFNECAKNSRREALRSFVLEGSNWIEKLDHDQDMYFFTNWCGFPFYEADFGWGKPASVGTARLAVKNWIQMMDTRGGGIEVLASLEEKHMRMFESDEELLAFASV